MSKSGNTAVEKKTPLTLGKNKTPNIDEVSKKSEEIGLMLKLIGKARSKKS